MSSKEEKIQNIIVHHQLEVDKGNRFATGTREKGQMTPELEEQFKETLEMWHEKAIKALRDLGVTREDAKEMLKPKLLVYTGGINQAVRDGMLI
jgi:hypothetical protein